jgi:TetR/AcrR family transcriptional regulator
MTEANQAEQPQSEPTRKRPKPGERRLQILQTMAGMLEEGSAERITTAALAAKLQVSEAALYRHFASKAQMFEGLLEFIEQTIFGLINQIDAGADRPGVKARAMVMMLLNFAEKNPGMTRVLVGDAIVFEHVRLQQRVNQLIDRAQASIRQSLKLAQASGQTTMEPSLLASLAMGFVLGRWLQFAKTNFAEKPTQSAAEIVAAMLPA